MSDGDKLILFVIKLFDLFQSFSKPLYNVVLMSLDKVSNWRQIVEDGLDFDTSSTTNVSFVGMNIMNSIFNGGM